MMKEFEHTVSQGSFVFHEGVRYGVLHYRVPCPHTSKYYTRCALLSTPTNPLLLHLRGRNCCVAWRNVGIPVRPAFCAVIVDAKQVEVLPFLERLPLPYRIGKR